MAKLRAGILGQVSGKVSGVVGGTWKDKNYVREYVVPANPNTAAQQTQRGLFSGAVEFCKPLVGPVFNAYTDKFQAKMSGYNYFIKRNIAYFTSPPAYSSVKVTEGKLFPVAPSNVVADSATNLLSYEWSTSLGSNGSDDDAIMAVALNKTTGRWGFQAAEHDRSTGGTGSAIGLTMTAGDVIELYIFAAAYVSDVLNMISDSTHDEVTAADV